jgi:hypothetical protein
MHLEGLSTDQFYKLVAAESALASSPIDSIIEMFAHTSACLEVDILFDLFFLLRTPLLYALMVLVARMGEKPVSHFGQDLILFPSGTDGSAIL